MIIQVRNDSDTNNSTLNQKPRLHFWNIISFFAHCVGVFWCGHALKSRGDNNTHIGFLRFMHIINSRQLNLS